MHVCMRSGRISTGTLGTGLSAPWQDVRRAVLRALASTLTRPSVHSFVLPRPSRLAEGATSLSVTLSVSGDVLENEESERLEREGEECEGVTENKESQGLEDEGEERKGGTGNGESERLEVEGKECEGVAENKESQGSEGEGSGYMSASVRERLSQLCGSLRLPAPPPLHPLPVLLPLPPLPPLWGANAGG